MKKIIPLLVLSLLFSCTSIEGYLGKSYVRIYEKSIDSVVEIISVGFQEEIERNWYDNSEESDQENKRYNGIGSGFIVEAHDTGYYIISNKHVVGNLNEVEVILSDGTSLIGEVLGGDERFDLAVIKIDSDREITPLSYSLKRENEGEFVAVLGSPLGYSNSISMGIISYYGRYGGPDNIVSDFIQTDAAINQGNSGGPMVNLKGEVIGLNTWILAPTGGNIGLGFAIPFKNIYPSYKRIVERGENRIGWLGVVSNRVPNKEYYSKDGAFIYNVVKNSPAYSVIKPGDIILFINGRSVVDFRDLVLEISLLESGDLVNLTIIREGEENLVEVTLGSNSMSSVKTSRELFPGVVLDDIDNHVEIVSVLSQSVAQQSGLIVGDRVISLNNQRVLGINDFYTYLKKGTNLIKISRDEEEFELELMY